MGLVSRETFDFEKLAITQFPAIQVWTASEERADISMSERQGRLQIQLKCYLRGDQIDTKRNNLIENIEQVLETNRNRNITVDKLATHYVDSRLIGVEVVERQPPLGEMTLTFEVIYVYKRGNA